LIEKPKSSILQSPVSDERWTFFTASGIQYYLSLTVLYRKDQPLTGTGVTVTAHEGFEEKEALEDFSD
jgi:hypothetical protein